MKDYQGFKNNGNWYKGNLHSHTTISDGKMTPEQSVEVYKEHGYNFLALSEHDIYTDYRKQYNTDNFIMIPAIEASAILYQEEGSSKRLEIHHLVFSVPARCRKTPRLRCSPTWSTFPRRSITEPGADGRSLRRSRICCVTAAVW